MNREETKKLLAERSEQDKVMQHFVDGGEVELFATGDNKWILHEYPNWDWENYEYRIKPKLPEVGKWYEKCGHKFKCIGYEFNTYVFMYKDGSVFTNSSNDDFTNFKQVVP